VPTCSIEPPDLSVYDAITAAGGEQWKASEKTRTDAALPMLLRSFKLPAFRA